MQSTIGAALQTGLLPRKDVIALLQAHIGRNYRATGEALRQIKTIGSWKREGFESYGQYCQAVWGITEERADLLIQAWALCKLLTMNGITEEDLPASEEVAVTLLRVTGTGDICEFWRGLIQHHNPRKITSRTIYKALKPSSGSSAIVVNPRHPLLNEIVTIRKVRGESVLVDSSAGQQMFVSPELRPCLAATS